ncbi:hypothetical protein [Candidatus Vampirococcus lugosii]|nr:hypothetical protein [Candidatus Vampirococcus lugosii]
MKKILFIIIYLLLFLSKSFSVDIAVPSVDSSDVGGGSTESISGDKNFWIELIDVINAYLWFFIGVVSMAMLLYGGYSLIYSKGDEEEFRRANRILYYGGIGIFVSLLSYVGISLLVNLF